MHILNIIIFVRRKTLMKNIGFLSFGHWGSHPSYQTRSAGDTLLQSIELAVAAEELGIDGAYFRVPVQSFQCVLGEL